MNKRLADILMTRNECSMAGMYLSVAGAHMVVVEINLRKLSAQCPSNVEACGRRVIGVQRPRFRF